MKQNIKHTNNSRKTSPALLCGIDKSNLRLLRITSNNTLNRSKVRAHEDID
jgi:hypothetical protein